MQPQKELQLDFETNNTQNHQKIKLYGSPATKDLKKPHSSRQVGREETQRRVERSGDTVHSGEAASAKQVVPHSRVVGKNREGYFGSEQSQPQARPHNPEFQCQEDK